jgi:hypothetical protein
LFIGLDLPVDVLSSEFAEVFLFLGVVGVHFGHGDVKDGFAAVGDIVIRLQVGSRARSDLGGEKVERNVH